MGSGRRLVDRNRSPENRQQLSGEGKVLWKVELAVTALQVLARPVLRFTPRFLVFFLQ